MSVYSCSTLNKSFVFSNSNSGYSLDVLSSRSGTIGSTFEWIIYLRYKMFSSKPTQFSNSCNTTRQSSLARMSAQITLDAELGTKYEDSGDSFDYPMLLEGTTSNLQQERSEEDTAYL